MEKFDDYLKTRLTKKEIENINTQAIREYECLRGLQQQVSFQLEEYMKAHNIGFNELARRLDFSASQLSRITKGKANITLATLSHMFSIIEKKPVLNFTNI